MNILFINYEFPPLGGGAGRAMASLAREMAKHGHTVRVLTSQFGALPSVAEIDDYTVSRVWTLRRELDRSNPAELLAFMLISIPAALREGARYRPDVTIAFFGIPSGPAALALRLIFSIPYIVSLRGLDVPGFRVNRELSVYNRLMKLPIRLIWRNAASVITNSIGLQKLAHQTAPNQDIAVIPNGVSAAQFVPRSQRSNHHSPRLLYVGRLIKQKGLHHLIKALQLLDVPHHLLIVGDGSERSNLERLTVESGLEDRITFCGWQSHEDVLGFYQEADIFVLPSEGEGMPNVLLEAMACGLPIVATQVSGSEDLLESGQNGVLVPPGDPVGLAEALRELLEDDVRRKHMGQRGLEMVKAYSWEACAERYLEVVRNVLSSAD